MENLFVPHYFTFEELLKTDTGLANYPIKFEHIQNLVLLGAVLDYIRNEVQIPILVNSAFRTPEVNKAVRGAKNSYHLKGLAADIHCWHMDDLNFVLNKMKDNGFFTELIAYPTFFHVAINPVEAFALLKDKLNEYIY